MHKIKAIFVIMLITVISISVSCNKDIKNVKGEDTYYYKGKENIQCLYFDEKNFINIKNFKAKNTGSIVGCILPHHLTASDLIHEVFQNIDKTKYDTVILVGPDHESLQMGKIFTTTKDYQTPFGILKTNEKLTNILTNSKLVVDNDEKLTSEHSTSSIVPFIKYYLDVNIVTLAITKQAKIDNIDKIIELLCENIQNDRTLFIASVDFSHYLDLENANKMDIITMDAIENKNINKIMLFNNDYLDSPISIVTLLKLMDKLNVNNTQLLNHSNTELIMQTQMKETTSYLTYLFYK